MSTDMGNHVALKLFDMINEFNVQWYFVQLTFKSVFADTCPCCLLSKRCFEKIVSKGQGQLIWGPLPEDLPDKLKPFVPVCSISLGYGTPNLPGLSWQGLFIVVEYLPLPEDVSVDCNISIVFPGQIREKLETIMEVWRRHCQQPLGEATEIEMAEESAKEMNGKDQEDKSTHEEGEKGGETQPNEEQGDVEDVDHGDWVIVGGSGMSNGQEQIRWAYSVDVNAQDERRRLRMEMKRRWCSFLMRAHISMQRMSVV